MSTVRVGLVGVANHGTTILNAIRESGTLTLTSCSTSTPRRWTPWRGSTGIRAARSYEDLLADPALDAVALVTPNHLHHEQVRLATRAGKHLFVEKPIANDVGEGKEILRMAVRGRPVLFVGHNTRRRQSFRRAAALIADGTIGTVAAVEGNLSRPAGLLPGLPPWKADPRTCPLLPMMQLGIHLVDTVEFLLGPVEEVSCIAAAIAMPGAVYDSTASLLKLASGVPVSLASYYVTPDAFFLRIYGTKGLLHITPTRVHIERINGGAVTETKDEDFPDEGTRSYTLQMREFGECVLTGRQPETDGPGGLRALAAIEAMTRSVAERRTVRISEVLA